MAERREKCPWGTEEETNLCEVLLTSPTKKTALSVVDSTRALQKDVVRRFRSATGCAVGLIYSTNTEQDHSYFRYSPYVAGVAVMPSDVEDRVLTLVLEDHR